jgi:hypothetical protein
MAWIVGLNPTMTEVGAGRWVDPPIKSGDDDDGVMMQTTTGAKR